MSTTFYLIRHGSCDSVGKRISGRMPGVYLNEEGRREARELAERMENVALDAIYSSPLERARETAEPLARKLELPVRESPAFHEIDFGDWTNKSFDELAEIEEWRQYNHFRSGIAIPGGERMVEVQARVVAELERLKRMHPDQRVAVFTHADVIRMTVLHYLGSPAEFNVRLEISPASVSVLQLGGWGPEIRCLNFTGKL